MFGWVIVSRQIQFHIYYLFVLCMYLNVLYGEVIDVEKQLVIFKSTTSSKSLLAVPN
jgi:hypothetical protein